MGATADPQNIERIAVGYGQTRSQAKVAGGVESSRVESSQHVREVLELAGKKPTREALREVQTERHNAAKLKGHHASKN